MLILIFSIILVIGLLIAGTCYGHLIRTYNKYADEPSSLNVNAINFIATCIDYYKLQTRISLTDGELTDAYSTKKDVIFLSEGVAYGKSVSDISVATHELGHAFQKQEKSSLLALNHLLGFFNKLANFLLPIALLCCLVFLFFEELEGYVPMIFYISVGLWFLTLLFKIITIPLELDASKRAYKILSDNKLLTKKELRQTREVLNAAALTYIGSLFAGIYKLLLSIKRSFRR